MGFGASSPAGHFGAVEGSSATGSLCWGPQTFNETDTTLSIGSVIVKSIVIDGSRLPGGPNQLGFSALAGQVQYMLAPGSGINILIGPTNDPIHNFDGTILYFSGGELVEAPTWVDFSSLRDGGPVNVPFTNPNPAGLIYLTLTGACGGAPAVPEGFRNYTFEICPRY
jgi:hypothetical protein